MTIDELLELVPEKFRPIVTEYGPALLKMTTAEIWAWIKLLANGDYATAYRQILKGLTDNELMTEWENLKSGWTKANRYNVERIELSEAAGQAILRVLLTVALTLVGL